MNLRNLHHLACLTIGILLIPALFLAVTGSPTWLVGWVCACIVLVVWESIQWPRGGQRP